MCENAGCVNRDEVKIRTIYKTLNYNQYDD